MYADISPFKRSLILLETFFRIGAFTIGGGLAMLPIIEKEFVSRRKWVSEEEMIDILAIVQSLPGVIAFNTSMFIGYKVAGLPGAVLAAIGMMLPSLIIITIFALFYVSVQDNLYIQGAFMGIRSGVTAMIGLAGIRLGKKVLTSPFKAVLAAASFTAVWFFDVHAALVIIFTAALGLTIHGMRTVRNHGNT